MEGIEEEVQAEEKQNQDFTRTSRRVEEMDKESEQYGIKFDALKGKKITKKNGCVSKIQHPTMYDT